MCVPAKDVKRVVTEATMTDRLRVMTNLVLEKCSVMRLPFVITDESQGVCVFLCTHSLYTRAPVRGSGSVS